MTSPPPPNSPRSWLRSAPNRKGKIPILLTLYKGPPTSPQPSHPLFSTLPLPYALSPIRTSSVLPNSSSHTGWLSTSIPETRLYPPTKTSHFVSPRIFRVVSPVRVRRAFGVRLWGWNPLWVSIPSFSVVPTLLTFCRHYRSSGVLNQSSWVGSSVPTDFYWLFLFQTKTSV